jgi:hypothetical protein
MFAAVSRWVAAGPYQVEQGGLPWGPKVPREGPAQEALHTPWWIKPLRINQSLIHPYPNTWVDHTRTAATAGPLSGLLVNYAPPPIGTAKGAAAGCVLGLVATYGRGAAAKKAVFGASTSRSNSSLQLAPGCWFNNVTVNASPRCVWEGGGGAGGRQECIQRRLRLAGGPALVYSKPGMHRDVACAIMALLTPGGLAVAALGCHRSNASSVLAGGNACWRLACATPYA